MNDIQIFSNPDFGEVRTILIDGEPWFCGRDVAISLGYAKPQNAIRDNVDEEDARKQSTHTNGGMQELLYVNESGLYSLIFGSKLENAKKFKKWVTSEVLPTIRRTGQYGQARIPMTIPEQIKLLAQGNVELNQRVDGLEDRIDKIELDLPLLPIEAEEIVRAVKKKGIEVLGTKQSPAYKDRGLRQKVYNDIYSNLKHNFNDVRSYKAMRRRDAEKAVQVVNNYNPPLFLSELIQQANAQICMEDIA